MVDAQWLRAVAVDEEGIYTPSEQERFRRIADRLERPEAVTDEMVAAGVEAWHGCDTNLLLDDEIRAIITAALSKVSPLIVGPK